jgi:hypothetical protein
MNDIQFAVQWGVEQLTILVKVVIWPLVTLTLIKHFEFEIKSLISNIKSISGAGIKAEMGQQHEVEKEDIEAYKELAKNLTKENDNYKDVQNRLAEALRTTEGDRSILQYLYHFEKTYRVIFSDQLLLLQILEREGNVLEVISEALFRRTRWYNITNYYLYMGFLINSQLITLITNTNPNENYYVLTELGKFFLNYLRENKIPLNKG